MSDEVFLSYSREDQTEALMLRNALRAEKISVWWDDDLLASGRFEEKIDQKLKESSAIVVLWSEASVESKWVNYEAAIAKGRGVLAPVKIQECDVPELFNSFQTTDLTQWKGHEDNREFIKLIRSIGELRGENALSNDQKMLKPSDSAIDQQTKSDNLKQIKNTAAKVAAIVSLVGLAIGGLAGYVLSRSGNHPIETAITTDKFVKAKWPHAIRCGSESAGLFYQHVIPLDTSDLTKATYTQVYPKSHRYIQFSRNGEFFGVAGDSRSATDGCRGKSMDQLKEENKVLYFYQR